jgi:hypothetical protein
MFRSAAVSLTRNPVSRDFVLMDTVHSSTQVTKYHRVLSHLAEKLISLLFVRCEILTEVTVPSFKM